MRRIWTKEEDALLRKSYPNKHISELLTILPGRSKKAIEMRCRTLGIKKGESYQRKSNNPKAYTEKEDAYIRKFYPIRQASEIAKTLKRTENSIRLRAKVIGVKRGNWMWKPQEDEYLRDNYTKMRIQAIADHLGKTYSAVDNRITTLKLRKSKNHGNNRKDQNP